MGCLFVFLCTDITSFILQQNYFVVSRETVLSTHDAVAGLRLVGKLGIGQNLHL